MKSVWSAQQAAQRRHRRDARMAAGLCIWCPNPRGRGRCCATCLARRNARERATYARRRGSVLEQRKDFYRRHRAAVLRKREMFYVLHKEDILEQRREKRHAFIDALRYELYGDRNVRNAWLLAERGA
jgi:hypothetical protein